MPFVNNWNALGVAAPVIALLLMLSVVALAIVLAKVWQLRSAPLRVSGAMREALALAQAGHYDPAVNRLSRHRGPVAQLLAGAVEGLAAERDAAAIREAFERQGTVVLMEQRVGLRTLEMIGHLAPLLGLFGTVLGMIEAFQALEAAAGPVDPAMLSGGIWAALSTTALGLAVAVPSVIAFNLLDQRSLRFAQVLDGLISELLVPDVAKPTAAPQP